MAYLEGSINKPAIRAFHSSELQQAGAELGPHDHDKSQCEFAMESLSNANNRLNGAISRLADRLAPVLGESAKVAEGGENRPRMSAELPESILTQAEVLESHVANIHRLIERLAI